MKGFLITAVLLAGGAATGAALIGSDHPGLSLKDNPSTQMSKTVRFDSSKGYGNRRLTGLGSIEIGEARSHKIEARNLDHSMVIKGSLMYSAKWPNNSSRWGMYAMPATGGDLVPLTGEETYNKLDYLANGGATAMNDGYYYICTYAWKNIGNEEEVTAVQGTIFDSNTWQPIKYKGFSTREGEPDTAFLTTSMAYDKTTGKIYGSFYGYDEELYSFGIFDAQEFKLQVITLMEEPWSACAFDNEGNLYAMLENGDFCSVNKRSGETSVISKTGLSCPFQTSGTINPEDGKFYYINVAQNGSVLYAIDLTTGKVDKVYEFGFGVQLIGMYFSEPDPSLLAPDKVSGLTINFNGTLEADLEFTLPSKTLSGDVLSGEIEYVVSMDYNPYATGKGTAGEKISVPVKVETSGSHYFDVVCSNAEGRGPSANHTAFAGEKPGLPMAARNLTVLEDKDHWGRITLTWDAPETDVNGKPINPDDVAYWVCDNQIYSWCKDYHGNSLVINMGDLSKKQKFDDFLLLSGIMIDGQYSYNWEREGYTTTRARSFGRPYDLPWKERITQNGPDWNWVMISSPNFGHWHYWDGVETEKVTVVPLGNDGGMFLADADKENVLLEIRGGKVDLGNAENPMLIFHIYRHQSFENDYVAAYVFEADHQPGDFFKLFSTHAETPEDEGWTECVVPLSDFKTKKIQVSLVAVCSKTSSLVAIDEIEIRNCRDNDLGITEFSTPATLVPGKKVDFGVTVRNWGNTDIPSAKVNLVCDKQVVATQNLSDIKAGESRKLVFDQTASPLLDETCEYYAEVILDNDQDEDNNRSQTVSIEVKHNEYPTPSGLVAHVEGDDVTLSWDEPELTPIEVLNDSFEDYSDDKLGNWNASGWIIFTDENIKAKTGEAMIASIPGPEAPEIHTLISPRLSGNAQKVMLYARSGESANRASFDILVSSTGTDEKDFSPLASKSKMAAFWTKCEFDLPEGTHYFAIRHNAENEEAGRLLFDDISYECHGFDNLLLNGYNIYHNGRLINSEPHPEMEFFHEKGAFVGGNYHVTCVYEQGESKACEPAYVMSTGLSKPTTVNSDVYVADGFIIVKGCRAYTDVYTLDGICIANSEGKGDKKFHVQNGMYIVIIDDMPVKVLVK